MVWRDLFRDTLRTLFAHKLRTLLTMFGIAWGIVSITLMVAAGEGLRVGQAKVASAFSKDAWAPSAMVNASTPISIPRCHARCIVRPPYPLCTPEGIDSLFPGPPSS